jgi:hypothetical protein
MNVKCKVGLKEKDCDGLTTCHVYSIAHSYIILVKRGRLGRISEIKSSTEGIAEACYPFGDKA